MSFIREFLGKNQISIQSKFNIDFFLQNFSVQQFKEKIPSLALEIHNEMNKTKQKSPSMHFECMNGYEYLIIR